MPSWYNCVKLVPATPEFGGILLLDSRGHSDLELKKAPVHVIIIIHSSGTAKYTVQTQSSSRDYCDFPVENFRRRLVVRFISQAHSQAE